MSSLLDSELNNSNDLLSLSLPLRENIKQNYQLEKKVSDRTV